MMIIATFQLILCIICMLSKLSNGDIINPIGDFWIPIDVPGAESVAIDTTHHRIFAADPTAKAVHILDFTFNAGFTAATITEHPTTPIISMQDVFDTAGESKTIADVTSVAYSSVKGWIVACVVPESHATTPGWLAFIDTTTLDVFKLLEMPSCFLPDHVSVTSDGNTLIVACEGEPDDNELEFPADNPEGVVAIVDVSHNNHRQWSVTNAGFNSFDSDQGLIDELYLSHQTESLSVNAEPEFSAISFDDKFAYVCLQELNAIAALDLATKQIIGVYPLGVIDFNVHGLDASDRDGKINIVQYENVYGMRAPDAIDYLHSAGGGHYLFTANEGDSKDFDEVRVKDVTLSANTFQGIPSLQKDKNLGRLKVSNLYGQNAAGEYEELYAFSSRDFTIWKVEMDVNGKPDHLDLTYSSDNLFELKTAELLGTDGFNSDYEYDTFDQRSDAKGPEPESIVVGKCNNGKQYAFIGLERVGGIFVFDITGIDEDPVVIEYKEYYNSRDFTFDWDEDAGNPPHAAGHIGPEQLRFIEKDVYGEPLLIVAYPESSSIAIYRIDCENYP